MPSHGIVPKQVSFLLQLYKAVLENVADADDSGELVAVFDRHMANAPLDHQLHHIGDPILRRANKDRLRHQFGDRNCWQPVAVRREAIGEVTFGEDAVDGVPITASRPTHLFALCAVGLRQEAPFHAAVPSSPQNL